MKKSVLLFVLLLFVAGGLSAQRLTLMTYNIRYDNPNDGVNSWSNRKDYFCSQLTFYAPDILGIQEALPNQVADIAASLPQYTHVGIARDGVGKGEASPIFLKKDRFKVQEEKTFWLSDTPEQVSKGWDAALNRVCTYVLLQDYTTKQAFWVFNTHLDHQGVLARANSIALILSKIKSLNVNHYPVFFMGDFNSEPTDKCILSVKTQLLDSRDITTAKPFGPSGTFNGFNHNESVTKRIDYIFLSEKNVFTVTKYAVLSDSNDLLYPSDHLPVYIEVTLH